MSETGEPPAAGPEAAFAVNRTDKEDGRVHLRFAGPLVFAHAAPLWKQVRQHVKRPGQGVIFDLAAVATTDGSAMALLVQLCAELEADGVSAVIVGATGRVQTILQLYQARIQPAAQRPKRAGIFERTGRLTAEFGGEIKNVLGFVGAFIVSLIGLVRRPGTANWRDVPPIMERAGADGVPIVLLINFLVGLVMAFQGAVQLKRFGANIFVADLVALSICRELGPLMTAIIVCGRSGAAYAAELGTMKVNEEIDALRTMGFDPMRYLVFPRALSLMVVVPMLTLLADFVAMIGGLLVGVLGLDLTVTAYVVRTQQALDMGHVFSGVSKSVAFGIAIALIACQQGLAASGGAQGVGRRTTSSVVAILFALIILDATFTVIMTVFDL